MRRGIHTHFDYTGIDISKKNIYNCLRNFKDAHTDFSIGDISSLSFPDHSFEIVIVNDLFEHLSLAMLPVAIKETLRVGKGLVVMNFFNARNDIVEHESVPIKNYHWNTLSLPVLRNFLISEGLKFSEIEIVKNFWPINGGKPIIGASKFGGRPRARAAIVIKRKPQI